MFAHSFVWLIKPVAGLETKPDSQWINPFLGVCGGAITWVFCVGLALGVMPFGVGKSVMFLPFCAFLPCADWLPRRYADVGG